MRLESSYLEEGFSWLRGNLHTHTTNSDGAHSPRDTAASYAAMGYDFLMVSDHDRFTDPANLNVDGMTLIPGVEVTADGPHLLAVGTRTVAPPDPDRQVVIDRIAAEDQGQRGAPFTIMCHPNWEDHFNHCPQERLEEWQGYAGIEVCNGVCFIAPGSGYALDRWDRLLGAGRRVWGYGNDDCHHPEHYGLAWNMVQCPSRDPKDIVDALRMGRLYVSTGVTIDRIHADGATVLVEAADAQRIIAISDFGRRELVMDGDSLEFTVPDDAMYSYIRFECYGQREAMAVSQPFFVVR